MPEPSLKPAVRPDASVIQLYNDARCVYLCDETALPAIERLITSGGVSGTKPDATLFENLETKDLGREVAATGLALAYELAQDDPVSIEIAVGAVGTKKELSVGRWLKPQTGYLLLPSGRLRIDSANTIPIGPANTGDQGALLDVPPGHYRVTLIRTDWDALEREESLEYEGSDELLFLTPLEGPPAKPGKTPVLPYVAPIDPEAWRGSFSVSGKSFAAQVTSSYWWTPLRCNLTPEAIGQLGLEPGSLFRLNVFNLSFVVLYLGEVLYVSAARSVGEERFKALSSKYPELAIAHWQEWKETLDDPAPVSFLTLQRPDGQKAYPAKGHNVWVQATGEVLEDSYPE